MTEISGHAPDPRLGTDLFATLGRLRRIAASLNAPPMQIDSLQKVADEVIQWQQRLRKAVVDALGHHDMNLGWDTIVNQVASTVRERDSAQLLHRMAAQDLADYDAQWTAQREELDALRAEERDA
jgi:hypothetical protein